MGIYLLPAVIAYFIGNFTTSYLICKYFAKIDIREHGSGNAGATNVLRVLGKKAALATFLGDAVKGALAVYIGRKIGGNNVAFISALCVIIGHNWPITLNFRGGKGVATSIGSMIGLYPLESLICIVIGIAIIYKSRYVSLGSMIGVCIFPIFMYFKSMNEFILSLFLALLILFTHRENIKRLLKGKENKLGNKA